MAAVGTKKRKEEEEEEGCDMWPLSAATGVGIRFFGGAFLVVFVGLVKAIIRHFY